MFCASAVLQMNIPPESSKRVENTNLEDEPKDPAVIFGGLLVTSFWATADQILDEQLTVECGVHDCLLTSSGETCSFLELTDRSYIPISLSYRIMYVFLSLRFDIMLMKEGRMKGQAFVGLPSEQSAEKALRETNGYVLFDKPLVVVSFHLLLCYE